MPGMLLIYPLKLRMCVFRNEVASERSVTLKTGKCGDLQFFWNIYEHKHNKTGQFS